MKKIGIDARLYFQTGVGVYLRNLLHFLEKIDHKDLLFYIYILKQDSDKIGFHNKAFVKREVDQKWHSVKEQTILARELYRDGLDLMHFTYFSYPVMYIKKFIATVHDLILLEHKTGISSTKNEFIYDLKHFVFRNIVLANQLRKAKKIITPTKTIKNKIIKTFGPQYSSKITAIYEGVNYEIIEASENRKLESQFKDFYIYIGNFYPHKNVEGLVRAFAKSKSKKQLLLIGPDDFFAKRIKEVIEKLKQKKRIIMYHEPTIQDFVFFYKNAKALIHPSLSEGFGLPLVEASYFECPVIGSNIEVFKEILDDQYLSFDPEDEKDITKKIDLFEKNNPEFKAKNLIERYSFENMAKETLEIYKKNI